MAGDPNSIVDYLSSTGAASDYSSRAALAAKNGISGYTGSAAQNTQLLNTLKTQAGTKQIQPVVNPPAAPSSTPSSSLAVNSSPTTAKPSPQSTTGAASTNQGGNTSIVPAASAVAKPTTTPAVTPPTAATPTPVTKPTATTPATATPPASANAGQPQLSPQAQAEVTRAQQVYAQADQLAGTGKYVGQTPDQVRAAAHAYADSLRAGGPVGPDAAAAPPANPVPVTDATAAVQPDGTVDFNQFKNADGTYDLNGAFTAWQSAQATALQKVQATTTAEAEQNYTDSMAQLNGAQDQLEIINQQRQALINSSDAAQKADADAAYTANKAAVDLQQQKTDKAYNDMVINQQLANKRATVAKETALGVLGGGFTTAGVAAIQDVIMQGEYKVLSLQQDHDIQTQGLTNQLVNVTNDYKTDNLKIEQYKDDQMNKAYSDLQSAIANIQADKLATAEQKQASIDAAANNYNQGLMTLNTDALNARVTLSNAAQARLDTIKQQALAQTVQDTNDAKSTLNTMLSTLTGASLDAMSPAQRQYLVDLGKKAGINVDFILQNMSATAKQAALDAAKVAAKKAGSGSGYVSNPDTGNTAQDNNFGPGLEAITVANEAGHNDLTKEDVASQNTVTSADDRFQQYQDAFPASKGALSKAKKKEIAGWTESQFQSELSSAKAQQSGTIAKKTDDSGATMSAQQISDAADRVSQNQSVQDYINSDNFDPENMRVTLRKEYGATIANATMTKLGY